MIGPGEILAITSLVLQVVGAVDKAILAFDRFQNAPKELRLFRSSLARLQRNFDLLKAELEISHSTLDYRGDLEDIKDTLNLCDLLFRDSASTQQESRSSSLRAIWSTRESSKLDRYQKQIERHYLEIILPLWMAAISARGRAQASQHQDERTTASEPAPTQTVISDNRIEELFEGIQDLKKSNDPEDVLKRLDQTIQECWTRLGLPVGDMDKFIGASVARRMSTLPHHVSTLPHHVPTTLILETAPEVHRKLALERVHVMARDDQTRILRYQSKDMSLQVTHIIPFGCIPWTPHKNSARISFLTPHVITVIDSEGHHIYNIDPKYWFSDFRFCTKFQETIREREYLSAYVGVHDAVKISSGEQTLARGQVIKFWKRDYENENRLVTMTFMASSVGDHVSHRELDLSNYFPDGVYVLPLLRRTGESNEVKLKPTSQFQRSIRIEFETIEEARAFLHAFKASHPTSTLPLRVDSIHTAVPSSSSTSSNTPAATPSDASWTSGAPPSVKSIDLNNKDDKNS